MVEKIMSMKELLASIDARNAEEEAFGSCEAPTFETIVDEAPLEKKKEKPKIYIPKFAYPYKRRSNTATKTKSEQEIVEEILFKDKQSQYLFNSSGLFHGGIHLKAEAFEIDFEVDGIRAIADGELVWYRIDKTYLKNTLEDTHNEFEVFYSSGFFLLEHKMEYPKGNNLKFYSLYMHTAPIYDYEFLEHTIVGGSAYARMTSDHSNADDFVKLGDKVVLGKPIANKDGRYELLTVNGIKTLSGINVHISNLSPKKIVTTIKGSKPNMREGNKTKSPSEGLLKDKSSITVNAYQTEEQKKNKRYKVLKAIKADGTEAVVSSKSTIHTSNLKAIIEEEDVYSKNNNGIVQPHMQGMAGSNLKPASKDFKVKAGEIIGKLGVYNSTWHETELDKVIHLEVFTFDDLKTFIEKAKEEYKKPVEGLSEEEKKLRPKENQLFIKKDVKRYVKESYTYAKLTEADWLRDKTVKNTKTDKTLNVLKVSKKPQKIKKDSILKINPTKDGSRYKIFSVEEGDSEVQSVVIADSSEKWSVYEKSIEIFHGFNEIPKEVKQYYVNVCKPLKTLKKLKDKEGTEYIQIDKIANIEIYVKDDEKYKTHGITFSNFTLIDEAGADKIGIFEDASKYYEKSTEEDATPQQEKEKLNDTFKAILQKLKVDKDKNGRLEAGEFASLSLTKEKRKELSYMMVKHESEWEDAKDKFQPILDYLDQDPKLEKNKKMFEDRLEKLAFFPKDIVGEGKTPTFIHPLALIGGFVGGSSCYCGRDFIVEEVKNIVKELRDKEVDSKGRATVKISDGYNLFTKKTSIPDTDKTYERFTEELNKTMKKYEINTCIRKIHFLAQSYTESNRFRSTEEEGSLAYLKGKSYYPYYGRGLLQLTWKGKEAGKMGYKQYFTYLGRNDYETKYSEVGSDLGMVMDVSGYFWNRGKLLSKGKILKSKYANAKGIKKNFSKKRVSSPTLTTLDLNQVADDDNVKQVTYLVNGAQSHISERTKYTNFLKEIFDYETCVNKK